jgi:hypothetical protein
VPGSTAFPFFIFGGTWLEQTATIMVAASGPLWLGDLRRR